MRQKLNKLPEKLAKPIIVFLTYSYLPFFVIIPFLFFSKAKDINEASFQLAFDVVFAIILYLLYKDDLKRDFKDFKHNNEKYVKSSVKYWLLGLVIMSVSNSLIDLINPNGIAANEQGIREMISNNTLTMVIATVIIAPFVEEIMFRKTFKDLFKNKWLLVLASSLTFGLAHVLNSYEQPLDLLYAIPYGALGGIFAYMYHKTNNIFTSMTIHAIHNCILVTLYITSILLGAI